MKPSMIEYEVLIGQVSHLKYVHEFMFENNEISFLMAGKSKLHLHEKSYLYKTLYYLSPSYACFKDMTTNYQVEVVDKATGKVAVQFSVLKDTLEMLKLVAKMKPTMIEFEVLIGQVSHLKYIHEFKFENNEISFLMAGKSKLHLDEKSYLYKTLYYLSPSYVCFKDMTTNYHVEVVDKATGKVDVQFSVLKDTLEMFHLAINNVLSPYKLILKAPYLVTSIEYEHLLMKVSINIINISKIYLL